MLIKYFGDLFNNLFKDVLYFYFLTKVYLEEKPLQFKPWQ